jgi:tight adherence protein B
MAAFAALMFFIFTTTLVFGLSRRHATVQAQVDRRLGRATGAEVMDAAVASDGASALRSSRLSKSGDVARVLQGMHIARSLGDQLERSGWRLSVTELFAVMAVSGLFAGVLASSRGPLLMLPGAVLGALFPVLLVRMAVKRRKKKFVSQLVDALTLIANALKAGQGLLQAIDAAANQLKAPIADEFQHTLYDIRVGATPDDAFAALNRRMESDDLDIVITAIVVQRSTGGNLAEILENVSHTMRERIRIRGEIKTLTTQQQFSGYLVAGIPTALLFLFNLMNHAYVGPLFTTSIGHVMLGIAGGLQLFGLFMIRRIVNIEV